MSYPAELSAIELTKWDADMLECERVLLSLTGMPDGAIERCWAHL